MADFREIDFEIQHQDLMKELQTSSFFRDSITDKRVLSAFKRVRRHLFVPEEFRSEAYENGPLPIGFEQTISQPFIIAYMMSLLNINSNSKVLEIGTGSGYQTALLCELAKFVYSVERIANLANRADEVLTLLTYDNYEISVHDGSTGWQEKSPFDSIIVSAEMPDFPHSLFDQLSENGKIVAPVRYKNGTNLMVVTKIRAQAQIKWDIGVRFVPLIGEEGF